MERRDKQIPFGESNIYNATSKSLLYHRKDPEKRVDLLLGPKGISAVNTGGTTIHSGLRIEPETMEPC